MARPSIRVRLTDAPYCAEPMYFLPHPYGHLSRGVLAAIVAVALAQFSGCSTINEHDRRVLHEHQIPAPLYQKMVRREPLALSEIAQLSARHVPADFIIRYVDSSLAEYQLTTNDVLILRGVGVSSEVIDYLLTTDQQPAVVVNHSYGPAFYHRTLVIHDRRR